MKLKVTMIRNAAPREKAYRMADGRGLSLLIQPTGSKLWQWVYRNDIGKQCRLSLGAFPEVTLDEARNVVLAKRKVVRLGLDEPAAAPRCKTFREAAREQNNVWEIGKNTEHVLRVWNRLQKDAMPDLGDRLLTDIMPADVVAVVRKVEERGALDVARRLKQKIGEVFGFSIAMGYCTIDPTAHVNRVLKPKPAVEHMARIPLAQMPQLIAALDTHPNLMARLGLRLTLLTACRSKEIREARWSEINGNDWVIPAERMKMGRPHHVPLSAEALEVVEQLRKFKRNDYLFPGPRRAVVNTNFLINALYDIGGGFRGRQTIHGFRGLFSTWANENEWNRDVVERCLAHVDENKVRSAYNAAELIPQRTKLMTAWADQINAWQLEGALL